MTRMNITEIPRNQSSHQHCCEVEGHYYECAEDCVCICGLPMNSNDHSECPVELRPCPEHEFVHEPMSEDRLPKGVVEIKFPADWRHTAQPSCGCGCSEVDAAEVGGCCFQCTHGYANYSTEIQDRHLAYDCPGAPAELKQAALASLAKRTKKKRARRQ